MQNDDIQLINMILSGDDCAFSSLVHKYQKRVHALAWREIGDFHYAEEITQDVFLQVYKKLSTLRNPEQFSGWLYVITKRRCINWSKRNKHKMKSLDEIPIAEIEEKSYIRFMSDKHEERSTDRLNAVVENLLRQLPESERTIVTLRYLGEMTPEEIASFIGVSVNTINSRIRRARIRLQEKQELLIQETLGNIQIPNTIVTNLMEQVTKINPKMTPVKKPMLPWATVGVTMVLVMIGLGIGNQYLTHIQRPYSFQAQSKPTIEIIDVSFIFDIVTTPPTQKQIPNLVNLINSNNKTADAESITLSPPEQKHIQGLTLSEIKEKLPELEEEIRTKLTRAVELYTELLKTDGLAVMTPEIAVWRDETWKEIKDLFNDVSDTGKALRYTFFLMEVGEQNPLIPGGWIHELIKPLPMGIQYIDGFDKPQIKTTEGEF